MVDGLVEKVVKSSEIHFGRRKMSRMRRRWKSSWRRRLWLIDEGSRDG